MLKKILPFNKQFMLLAACFLALSYQQVLAQSGATSSSITGVITDQAQAVINGASIKIRNLTTNIERQVVADDFGNYVIPQVTPGFYEVIISADGFKTQSAKLELELGTVVKADFALIIGNVDDVIEVTASSTINKNKTESSENIDSGRIAGLPINRRTFLDFTLTIPRAVADRLPAQGVSGTSGLSFNGQAGRYNNVSIDGVDNTDHYGGLIRTTFSQDAVQEFQVITDSFSAEFGRAIGGIVNIVTKGGGNDFHGSLFLLNRNDKISARDPFVSFRPPYSQYQFGSVFSGPIKKDKAFFFASFERLTVQQNNVVTISDRTVDAARRAGFSQVRNGAVPFSLGTSAFLARADVKISSNDQLWIRYNGGFNYNGAYEPFGGNTDQTSSGTQRVEDNSLTLNNTYINPNANLVNETRFLYSRRKQDVTSSSGNTPEIILSSGDADSAFFGNQQFLPFNLKQNITQVVNNVSLSRGANQIKFGVDYQHIGSPGEGASLSQFSQGRYIFNPINLAAITGIPTAPSLTGLEAFDPAARSVAQRGFLTFLAGVLPGIIPGFPANVPLADLGLPTIYLQGFGDPTIKVDADFFSAYVQDEIRVKPNFILKAGLRYDINRIATSPTNNGNFSPRLAFSYNPNKLPKLNIRGSYGLFFGTPFIGFVTAGQRSNIQDPSQNKLNFLISTLPLAVLPYSTPTRNFPSGPTPPPGVNLIPQLGLQFAIDKNLRNNYTQQLNFGFNYNLDNNSVISLEYVYVRGLKVIGGRNINPVVRPIPNDPTTSLIVGRVDPTRGLIFEYESAYDSYYNAFTASYNRRLSNKVALLASYTFSKGIDNIFDIDISLLDQPNDPLNPGLERGLSIQDVRSRFVASAIWELDYTKNILFRDFKVSTIINLNSGRPYNLVTTEDINMNGDGFLPSDRPFGLGRNLGLTPGFANVDLRLTRDLKIRERVTFQGYFEVFNAFNRVNFDPNKVFRFLTSDGNGGFNFPPMEDGRFITTPQTRRAALAPRQLQFGFRISF